MILLSTFQKKTQKTPDKELTSALTYMFDYIERSDHNET
ncbi:type II toxin-antitoxin system RelE/ParE family toxin [Fusibacter ferrireducens]|nr:hypothetical protein [Fusibacter ferrireducens]